MSTHPILQAGKRTYLRHPESDDAEEFLALRAASEEFHRPWTPAPLPGVVPNSDSFFAQFLAGAKTERQQRFLVCRSEDGRILGSINLSEIVRGSFQNSYVGYWIGVEFANQGYMTEALKLAVEYAFESLGLHRLEANIRPENEPSIALVKSAGFELEGYSPRYLKIAGEWCDHERWAIRND